MADLKTWMDNEGKSVRAFSRETGIPEYLISKLRHGRRLPSLEQALVISRATSGEVPPDEWVDLPPETDIAEAAA